MSTKQNPKDLGARCESCPFAVKGQPRPDYVLADIPAEVTGVLVADSPSHEDAALGRPLGGSTGRMLDDSLAQAGLSRQTLAVVPATACKAGPLDGPDARLRAAQCCKPAVMAQVKDHLAKPKLLMGASAATQFTKLVKGAVSFMRGFVREELNAIITWSPSYAYFTNPYEWSVFDGDVSRFARLIHGTLEEGPGAINTSPTANDLRHLVERAMGNIAVDIETLPCHADQPWTGKDPTKAVLRSIQFGNETEAISFLWNEASHELQQETKEVLENTKIVKVFHNGYFFDIRILRRYGMNTVNAEDTRDMRCALSATSQLSLRYVASLYTDLIPFKELGLDDSDK